MNLTTGELLVLSMAEIRPLFPFDETWGSFSTFLVLPNVSKPVNAWIPRIEAEDVNFQVYGLQTRLLPSLLAPNLCLYSELARLDRG